MVFWDASVEKLKEEGKTRCEQIHKFVASKIPDETCFNALNQCSYKDLHYNAVSRISNAMVPYETPINDKQDALIIVT